MEFVGTFLLCLTVACSAALSALAPLAIGGVLMCAVYAGGHISGANFNPAVSFALALRGALPWPDFAMYAVVQLAASLAAGGAGVLMMWDALSCDEVPEGLEGDELSAAQAEFDACPGMKALGHPAVDMVRFGYFPALLAEILYTFALVFVVLNVATTKANAGNQFFGTAIGFTVTAGACSGGPVSGGAFNPAVGFGLPLLAGDAKFIWVYFAGPLTGAALAVGAFFLCNPNERKEV